MCTSLGGDCDLDWRTPWETLSAAGSGAGDLVGDTLLSELILN